MIWALALLLPGILAQTCPPGGVFNTQYNKCFNIYSAGAQYSIAEQNCMNIGGHLVSVTNAFENSIIVDNAKNQLSSSNSSDFWIGANDLVSKGNWAWTDASNFVYNNWAAGQPSPSNDCATASLSNGQWNTVDCYQYRPYACASPPMGSSTCPPPPTCPTLYCPTSACTQRTCKPSCPSEWTYFGPTDSCYKSFFHSKWADAEDFCVQQGSHLASIHSQEENTFVARMTTTQLKETNPDDLTWIGLHKDGNSWVWTDGSKVDYINWAPKQPDNAGKENCVEIAQDKSHDGWFENWNNEKCDEMLRAFVCKTASSH